MSACNTWTILIAVCISCVSCEIVAKCDVGVNGHITFTESDSGKLDVNLHLHKFSTQSGTYKIHVHENAPSSSLPCKQALGHHFNPDDGVNGNDLGDLGVHSTNAAGMLHKDIPDISPLTLESGPFDIRNRGVGIHDASHHGAMIACCQIVEQDQ